MAQHAITKFIMWRGSSIESRICCRLYCQIHSYLNYTGRDFQLDAQYSTYRTPPVNWGVRIVPERTAFIVERFGKYNRTLTSGLHLLIPLVSCFISFPQDYIQKTPHIQPKSLYSSWLQISRSSQTVAHLFGLIGFSAPFQANYVRRSKMENIGKKLLLLDNLATLTYHFLLLEW